MKESNIESSHTPNKSNKASCISEVFMGFYTFGFDEVSRIKNLQVCTFEPVPVRESDSLYEFLGFILQLLFLI